MRPIYALILCIISLAAAPVSAQQSNYQQCAQLVQRAPDQALEQAEDWIQKENHPSAYHCRALALFALKRYPEAAKALERLSFLVSQNNPVLWGNVLRQSARSWSLANESAKAIIVLTKGINRTATEALNNPVTAQLCADLLLDRSKIYAAGGRDLFALQDLDQALSLSPDDPKLLIARAKLFLSQQENTLALRDLKRLQSINPTYPGLSQMIAPLQ